MAHTFSRIAFALLFAALPAPALSAATPPPLPRFTEEREAAALHFVGKHCPEMAPLLAELKKNRPAQYEQRIREIFQTTEMLADLQDEPRRRDIELKIWKAENRAFVLVARLTQPKEERKRIETQLLDTARELVDLEVQSLELRAEELERDLGETRDGLARLRENLDKTVRDRFDSLLDRARKRSKKS